jgi:hypothetical protein
MSQQAIGERTQMPFGVWIFAIAHTAYAVFQADYDTELLRIEHYQNAPPTYFKWIPAVLALLGLIVCLSWLVMSGRRVIRDLLLFCIAIEFCRNLIEQVLTLNYLYKTAAPELIHVVIEILGFATWLLLTYWYFLGPRTRAFFS